MDIELILQKFAVFSGLTGEELQACLPYCRDAMEQLTAKRRSALPAAEPLGSAAAALAYYRWCLAQMSGSSLPHVGAAALVNKDTLAAAKAFIKEVGYPVIVKPDNGCGAEATYKLRNLKELKAFYAEPHAVPYIMEEFINGTIVSFDGVADSHCVPLFYTSNVFPTPILDIVSEQGDLSYWTQKTVPAALKDVGFRTIKAFGAKSRFFHCEFFQLNEDKPGLGKKGDYVALEVNMRPAGGYTPDMINYANSADCYQIWADMVCYDEVRNLELDGPKYYCVYAGRRDCHTYKHSNEQIMARYGNRMKMHERIPEALRLDMGDEMYTVAVRSSAERDAFIRYVQEKA